MIQQRGEGGGFGDAGREWDGGDLECVGQRGEDGVDDLVRGGVVVQDRRALYTDGGQQHGDDDAGAVFAECALHEQRARVVPGEQPGDDDQVPAAVLDEGLKV
jgi:hypothetical protein